MTTYKLVKIEKGGPGSGHFGHSGRPGKVGGSAGSGGGSGGLKPGKGTETFTGHKGITDDEIDRILTPTKYTSKTKALRAYARQGINNTSIGKYYNRVKGIVPDDRALAFAVYITNAKMNGALQGVVSRTSVVSANWEANRIFMDNDVIVKNIFSSIKPSTLDNIQEAINVIKNRMSEW